VAGLAHSAAMPSDGAALASILTALGDLEARIAALVAPYEGSDREDVVGALYEAERSLRAAQRAVERAERSLG
jgi:hypothetical protein